MGGSTVLCAVLGAPRDGLASRAGGHGAAGIADPTLWLEPGHSDSERPEQSSSRRDPWGQCHCLLPPTRPAAFLGTISGLCPPPSSPWLHLVSDVGPLSSFPSCLCTHLPQALLLPESPWSFGIPKTTPTVPTPGCHWMPLAAPWRGTAKCHWALTTQAT